MPTYTTIVNNAGDFKWKPTSTVTSASAFPLIRSTNGLGVTRSVKIGTVPTREYTLSFLSSKKTYDEIYAFLLSKGLGHDIFTWRNPDDNILYSVRQTGGLQINEQSDNTSDQVKLSMEFSVKLTIQTDIQGL